MHLTRVTLRDFMAYDKLDLDLPARGIACIVGPNGAGKSTLIEACSFALWGKTLRGTEPWSGPDGLVEVGVEAGGQKLVARRARTKGKVTFTWDDGTPVPTPAKGTTGTTNTKTLDALERLVGAHDVWKRAAVFSSSDAAHFTLATDGDRKRLVERILGLEVFDGGLERVREDLKGATARLHKAEREHDVLKERLANATRETERATEALAQATPITQAEVDALDAKARHQKATLAALRADLARNQKERLALLAGGSEEAATLRQLEAALERLKAKTCPTCTREIPELLRQQVRREAETARKTAEKAKAKAEASGKTVAGLIVELEEELEGLVKRLAETERAASLGRQALVARQRAEATLEHARKSAEGAAEALGEAVGRASAAAVEVRELEAVEKVFGLRGVRVQVLGRALSGIERVANVYLSRFVGPEVSLSLKPYSESKTGKVSDALGLTLHGDRAFGNGLGYKAASNGERRRVDLALLLAFGETSAAAAGATPGTLFADEVLDGVDTEGVQRAADVLRELAAERLVLVVTHVPAVVAALRPDVCWRADKGRLTLG